MVNEGRGRLFRRKDEKYLIYLPKDLAEDSMFPFKDWGKSEGRASGGRLDSVYVKVSFRPGEPKALLIEKWEPEDNLKSRGLSKKTPLKKS